jgi:hypothetical protein
MNKQLIRDLAITGGIYDSICDPYDKLENGDYYSSVMVDLERFAEKIVAECTQVLFNEAERLNGLSSEETNLRTSDDLESCAEQCMDNIVRIEEHFGVEE